MSQPAASTSAPQAVGGIDLGGTKIEAIVTDAAHQVLGSSRHPTPTDGGPAGVANAMAAALTEAAHSASLDPAHLRGVGVGSPGVVDSAAGTVSNADNLPGWLSSFPLGPALQSALGTRVVIGNDVSVATTAEFELGAGAPYKSLLGVFWGTGVGGGLILDGNPWHGRGGAGEIGHMVIVEGGRRCPCGRRGCLEAYAGRAAMEARARRLHAGGTPTQLFDIAEEHGRDRLTSGIWERALEHGDRLATKLIDRAVLALGTGIASAVNLLDVEAVIIGGGLGVRFGEPYRARIVAAMMPHLFNDTRPPAVHVAALGDLGGAIGATLLID
ncbi:MAG: ROK family protein [Solirubrobacteraceae bacterium]